MLHFPRPRSLQALGWSLAGGVVITLLGSGPAAAADGYSPHDGPMPDPITDVFYLRATYFQATVRTELRIDPTNQPSAGTQLSGEKDLGLAKNNPLGSLELMFRIHERNRMRVDYFQLNRSSTMPLAQTIVFGNEVFPAGSNLQTTFNLRIMGFTYTRALIQTSRFELGAGLGVHLIDSDVIGNDPAIFARHETSVAGAFPTIALEGMWRISSRFAFTGRANYFGTSIHGFSGSLGNYHGDFQYRWQPNFALGLGYTYWRIGADSRTNGTPGRLTLAAQGPEAFVRVSF